MFLSLLGQTRQPDEILVFVSGLGKVRLSVEDPDSPKIVLYERPNLNDWGHEKRAEGLALASGDWIGWFNDDDSYDPRYLEKMMSAVVDQVDYVWCGWNSVPRPSFKLGSSTSGNWIVRTELARQVGYTDRHYEADGTMINRVREAARSGVFVPEILYFHNVQKEEGPL